MDYYKTIVIDLLVLGRLDFGMKLNTKGKSFTIDNYGYLQSASRFYRKDDRLDTVNRIEQLIKNLGLFIAKLLVELDKCDYLNTNQLPTEYEYIRINNLYSYIEKAYKGLENLSQTYIDDTNTWAKLSIEKDNLIKVNEMLKPYVTEFDSQPVTV